MKFRRWVVPMVFNSWIFLAFFLVFASLYFGTRKHLVLQNALIFVSSYIFYGAWDVRFLVLIMCCTTTDFITGLCLSGRRLTAKNIRAIGAFMAAVTAAVLIFSKGTAVLYCLWLPVYFSLVAVFILWADRQPEQRRRKAYLVGSITYNLSVLCFFKYFNFFVANFVALMNGVGVPVSPVALSVILPVGISFFTFQSMSFSLDVYRGKLTPTDQITKFAAYISFFPQLVAGPIERANHLLPQFDKARHVTMDMLRSAAVLFVWGLYKKVVVADNVAPLADAAFNHAATVSPEQMVLGVLAFTVQIYCDFSGYSDMARALARMLGFELMINFNMPYFSRSPSEFWRRWHISLSSWLRDYLYIGLGGNRGGELMTYRNLLLTMILGGMWHGATWTFIVWGFFHGSILVLYRLLRLDELLAAVSARSLPGVLVHSVAWAVMLILTMIGWIIFRSQSVATLTAVATSLSHGFTLDGNADFGALLHYCGPLFLVEIFLLCREKLAFEWQVPAFLRFNVALFVLCSLFFLSARSGQQFIYFDF